MPSKQLSVCSVVVTLNSHSRENTAGTVTFDESVAEWCMAFQQIVDGITIFVKKSPSFRIFFSKFDVCIITAAITF